MQVVVLFAEGVLRLSGLVADVPLDDLLVVVQLKPLTEVGQVLEIHLVEAVDACGVVREEAGEEQRLPVLHLPSDFLPNHFLIQSVPSLANSERRGVDRLAALVVFIVCLGVVLVLEDETFLECVHTCNPIIAG